MENPLVSIIIPVFNRKNLIIETLDSILVQTFTQWECIIVDDHSTDSTLRKVEEYCQRDNRFKLLVRPSNRPKGANSCRNFGFEYSLGLFINYFDSDDLMMPDKLEKQITIMQNSKYPFTVCQTLVFEKEKTNIIGLKKENIYSDDFFNDFVKDKIKWLTQAPLFRKSFLENNNLKFDETLSKAQERDFFIAILAITVNYHHDDTPLVLFRKHPDSISFGKNSKEKIDSTFRTNLKVLIDYREKLDIKSIKYLIQILKSELKKSLQLKEYAQSSDFFKKIKDLKVLSAFEKLKLKLGILSMTYLGKGERLIK